MNESEKTEYDKIWERFWEENNFEEVILSRKSERKLYYDAILKYANRFDKPRVMEIGCGTGIDINIINKRNKNIHTYASDISLNSIEVAKKTSEKLGGQVYYLAADTLNLAFKDCQFDVIYSQGLIEHFCGYSDVIKEQLRVLRAGGYLIINVPQKYTGYTLMKKLKSMTGSWSLGWETEFSYGRIKKLGRVLNLTERDVFGYQYWRSWWEPVFVLRDFFDKIHRRNPLNNSWAFCKLKMLYDTFWIRLEGVWGHYFLKNIVVVFQKHPNENTSC